MTNSSVTFRIHQITNRRFADLLLFSVTSVELVLLFLMTPTFNAVDWVYVLQHLIVLGVALTRLPAKVRSNSISSNVAVAVAYLYPYAQVIYLRWSPGDETWPLAGLILVTAAAALSLTSLVTIGKCFGVRPALRDLITRGPYRLVRHPMYLSYIIADIGYNFEEWNFVTLLLVLVGWISLLYRIRIEEKMLSNDVRWITYTSSVRYRLIPGLW